MESFEVGQIVEITKDKFGHGLSIGENIELLREYMDMKGYWVIKGDNSERLISNSEIKSL